MYATEEREKAIMLYIKNNKSAAVVNGENPSDRSPKNEHPFNKLLAHLKLPRSSYFYHRKIASLQEKYHRLKHRIKEIFEKSNKCYGYRRIHTMLAREGTLVSEKMVRIIIPMC